MTSPSHPLLYDNNQDCTWILSCNPGSRIKLNFIEFDLQPPNHTQCLDFVQVQEGRQGKTSPIMLCFVVKQPKYDVNIHERNINEISLSSS